MAARLDWALVGQVQCSIESPPTTSTIVAAGIGWWELAGGSVHRTPGALKVENQAVQHALSPPLIQIHADEAPPTATPCAAIRVSRRG